MKVASRPQEESQISNRRVPWWWVPIGGAVGAAVAVAATLGVPALTRSFTPPRSDAQSVSSGQDPAETDCLKDVKVVASETREKWYLIEVLYSDTCQAGWARITRYDEKAEGNLIKVRMFPRDSRDGKLVQTATEHDVESAYTTLLLRPTPHTLICADGSVSDGGKEIELGPPLCT